MKPADVIFWSVISIFFGLLGFCLIVFISAANESDRRKDADCFRRGGAKSITTGGFNQHTVCVAADGTVLGFYTQGTFVKGNPW